MRAPKKIISRARRLRRALSLPEVQLWNRLRKRAPGKPVFRRQHPIGPYVLDFYCAEASLAVEVDGISHDLGDRPQRDARRDLWLKTHGVTAVHILATELLSDIDETADAIVRAAAERV
jgi:very-short-patch-repair endonuclease